MIGLHGCMGRITIRLWDTLSAAVLHVTSIFVARQSNRPGDRRMRFFMTNPLPRAFIIGIEEEEYGPYSGCSLTISAALI